MFEVLPTGLGETLSMVVVSGSLVLVFGLPVGVLLFVCRPEQFEAHPLFHGLLSAVVNALRAVPFIILLVSIIPLTRLIVGTSIGTAAAIVPLAVGALPFVARIVEGALRCPPV